MWLMLITEMDHYSFCGREFKTVGDGPRFNTIETSLQLSFNSTHLSRTVADQKIVNKDCTFSTWCDGIDCAVILMPKRVTERMLS